MTARAWTLALTLLLIPLTLPAGAAPPPERLRVGFTGRTVEFLRVPDEGMTIIASCRKSSGDYECQAYSALERVSRKLLGAERYGGKNPGSLLCRKLGGNVAIGKDSRQNESSFCLFPDGSMVSCGSLSYQAQVNDR